MPDKIYGWFDQHNRDSLASLIAEHQIKSVLEIGSFLGLSAAWLAERVDSVICVDKFAEYETEHSDNNLVWTLNHLNLPRRFLHVFLDNMDAAGVADKVTVIDCESDLASRLVPKVDLVYIDGDHSYQGIKSDIELYLPKARKVICGDDYTARFPGILQATKELLPDHKSNGPFWWKVIGGSKY